MLGLLSLLGFAWLTFPCLFCFPYLALLALPWLLSLPCLLGFLRFACLLCLFGLLYFALLCIALRSACCLCFLRCTTCPRNSLVVWLVCFALPVLASFSMLVLLSLPCFACNDWCASFLPCLLCSACWLGWLGLLCRALLACFAYLVCFCVALRCLALRCVLLAGCCLLICCLAFFSLKCSCFAPAACGSQTCLLACCASCAWSLRFLDLRALLCFALLC